MPAENGALPHEICMAAVRAVAALPGVSAHVRSRWYSSAAVPPSQQGRFVNGAVRVRTSLAPAVLLAALHGLEAEAGRTLASRRQAGPNAARTLDLDIIDFAGLVHAAINPILPHLRAHQRAFVLLPLRDVAPGWRHPVTGQTVQALLDALPPQDIHPL